MNENSYHKLQKFTILGIIYYLEIFSYPVHMIGKNSYLY